MDHAKRMARLTIRLDFDNGASLGPGKIGLLEAVGETGSIRRAAERMEMSFRQAWLLLRAIEDMFGAPVVEALRGGSGGGGSRLTPLGEAAIAHYRGIERQSLAAAKADIAALQERVKGKARSCRKGAKAPQSRRSLRRA